MDDDVSVVPDCRPDLQVHALADSWRRLSFMTCMVFARFRHAFLWVGRRYEEGRNETESYNINMHPTRNPALNNAVRTEIHRQQT